MGGSVSAIENDFMQNEIARSAYEYQQKIESKEKIIVGVNKFVSAESRATTSFRVDDSIRQKQIDKLTSLKKRRNNTFVKSCLAEISAAAKETENLMPFVVKAVENYCTLGEISDTLRDVFGEYK